MFTAQLCVQGACKQADIIRAFGVSESSVLRSVKKYRQEGVQGFYKTRRTRGAPVMTPQVIQEAQQLFQEGYSRAGVARELDVPYDTLRKAIDQGRLELPDLPTDHQHQAPSLAYRTKLAPAPSDKSTRSSQDQAAGQEMGIACTRPIERVLAALGKLPGGASTQFAPCRDVSYGGVLCALPALAENGLFRHLRALIVTLGILMALLATAGDAGSAQGLGADGTGLFLLRPRVAAGVVSPATADVTRAREEAAVVAA